MCIVSCGGGGGARVRGFVDNGAGVETTGGGVRGR